MRSLHRIDSSYPIQELLDFCEESRGDLRGGSGNMDPDDWENKPGSLLYLLYKEKRFDGFGNGYIICKENERIICGAGFYLSDIDKMVCFGVRSYTIPGANCSTTHGDIKDLVFDIAREEGLYGGFTSFNEYNKRYVDRFVKINDPSNIKNAYQDDTGQWWAKPGRKISPCKSYGPVKLKETKQWIVYHLCNQDAETYVLNEFKKIDWKD